MLLSPWTSTAFAASSDVGFQDGLSDCQTGTSNAINGHSNAGHHSAAYMQAYNLGLASCNKDWKLTVNLKQTHFGPSSATVVLTGPFGYTDSKTIPIGPSTSVTFVIPSDKVPDNNQYKLCVSAELLSLSTVTPNCQFHVHGTGDEFVSIDIPA